VTLRNRPVAERSEKHRRILLHLGDRVQRDQDGGNNMAKRPTDKAKLKVWTERSTSEMEGPIKAIAYYLFMYVAQEDREQLLKDMQKWHEEVMAAA
jgi:hypothetical protein